jgi:hypothetical protein
MPQTQVVALLRQAEGQRLQVTFRDGITWSVYIVAVDDEGFLHSGPNNAEPDWWTRFDSVTRVHHVL